MFSLVCTRRISVCGDVSDGTDTYRDTDGSMIHMGRGFEGVNVEGDRPIKSRPQSSLKLKDKIEKMRYRYSDLEPVQQVGTTEGKEIDILSPLSSKIDIITNKPQKECPDDTQNLP